MKRSVGTLSKHSSTTTKEYEMNMITVEGDKVCKWVKNEKWTFKLSVWLNVNFLEIGTNEQEIGMGREIGTKKLMLCSSDF